MRLSNAQAAEVIADPRVAAVTLTGSTHAGKAVARVGGEALKPMVMELSSTTRLWCSQMLILRGPQNTACARAASTTAKAASLPSAFWSTKFVETPWIDALREGMAALRVGNACEPTTQIGPLARADLRDTLATQVQALKEAGASVLFEGDLPDQLGFFFPPMILRGVDPHHPASQEELFGPVITLYSFENEGKCYTSPTRHPTG